MNHLTDQQLNEYLDNVLGPSARRDARSHIDSCAACRRRLEEIQAVTAVLAGLPEAPLAHDLSNSVLSRLPQRPGRIWTRALAAQLGGALGMLLWLSAEVSKPVTALLLTLALPKYSVPSVRLPEYFLRFPTFSFQMNIPPMQVAIPSISLPLLHMPPFEPTLAVPVAILAFLLWIVGNRALLRAPNQDHGRLGFIQK